MAKKINRIAFLLLAFLFACNKEDAPDCIKTTGPITSEDRLVGSFDRIKLEDRINLILHQDTLQRIQVVAGKNLLPKIKTELSGSTLTIRNENKWNFMRSYKYSIDVHVYVSDLKKIFYDGGGDIKSANTLTFPVLELESDGAGGDVIFNLNCDSLKAIIHTGASNIYLTGTSNYTYLYSVGNSIFHTENFVSQFVHVNNGSTGDFYVNAVNTLLVEVHTASTTWYRGAPALIVQQIGTGLVKPLP